MKIFLFSQPEFCARLLPHLPDHAEIIGLSSSLETKKPRAFCKEKLAQMAYNLKLRIPAAHVYSFKSTAVKTVLRYTNAKNIPIYAPAALKSVEFKNALKALAPDLILSFGYPKLIPQNILDLAPLGGINIHPGKLPERGGGTPARWSVFYGDTNVYLTAHAMTNKFDAGEILEETSTPTKDDDDCVKIEQRTFGMLPALLEKLFARIDTEKRPYTEAAVTAPQILPPFRGPHQTIDWATHDSQTIKRICRAMKPKSGALTSFQGKEICLWNIANLPPEALEKLDLDTEPGTLLSYYRKKWPVIRTLDGFIIVQNILYGHQIHSGRALGYFYGIKHGGVLG